MRPYKARDGPQISGIPSYRGIGDRRTSSKSNILDGPKTLDFLDLSSGIEYFETQSCKNSGLSVYLGTRAILAQKFVSCQGFRGKVGMGIAHVTEW